MNTASSSLAFPSIARLGLPVECPDSVDLGVGQPTNFTACSSDAVCFLPSSVRPVASIFSGLMDRPPLGVAGVGHPVEPLPEVRGADAVCAQNNRPDGVTFCLQVC